MRLITLSLIGVAACALTLTHAADNSSANNASKAKPATVDPATKLTEVNLAVSGMT